MTDVTRPGLGVSRQPGEHRYAGGAPPRSPPYVPAIYTGIGLSGGLGEAASAVGSALICLTAVAVATATAVAAGRRPCSQGGKESDGVWRVRSLEIR
jgi:hypothetical protein